MIFHGAAIGNGSRVSAGAVVHARTRLLPGSHVGLRGYAVQGNDGEVIITHDVETARKHLAACDFFGTAFGFDADTMMQQNSMALEHLRREIRTWRDEPLR